MRLLTTPARRAVPFVLTPLAVLLCDGVAFAVGDTKDAGGLSFLNLERYDLGIFTLIVFASLCVILYFFAWPKISAGLAKREADFAAAKDEAVKAKHEAEQMREALKSEFAAAQEKIRAMMDEARRDADALKATEKAVGMKEAQAERDRAKREIDTAKEQALQEIQHTAVQLAALMSSKAVGRGMAEEDHRRLVAESLSELKNTVTRA
ncbi:MAG: ATP synthase F0 subunit B [Fimbriiglobus sp.]|jgi:F-type H+-transporting ATPase subunit b|nr:ATP synthase F0 subunit B [Fimbriiglobus sp.]